MNKAALLIDWDNVKAALIQSGFGCHTSNPEPLLRAMVRAAELAAEEWAPSGSFSLEFKGVAIPGAHLGGLHLGSALGKLNLEVMLSTAAKQAADLKLAGQALELKFKSGFQLFFLVSADVDYVDVANQLKQDGGECVLWLIESSRLRPETRAYQPKRYLEVLLELPKCPPIHAAVLSLFALSCQRLVDEGWALWSYHKSIAHLAARLPDQDWEGIWNDRAAQRWITGSGQTRRLRYENQELIELLTLTDYVLAYVGQRRACTEDEITSALSVHPVFDFDKHGGLLDLLAKAGYLRRDRGSYVLHFEADRRGTLRVLYWLALITSTVQKENGWAQVRSNVISQWWPRYVRPGANRQLTDLQLSELRADGRDAINRALVSGVVTEIATRRGYYRVTEGHPIVTGAERARDGIIGLLYDLGKDSPVAEGDVLNHMRQSGEAYGWSDDEFRFWLGALAAQRVVHRTGGFIRICNLRSPVVRAVLDEARMPVI